MLIFTLRKHGVEPAIAVAHFGARPNETDLYVGLGETIEDVSDHFDSFEDYESIMAKLCSGWDTGDSMVRKMHADFELRLHDTEKPEPEPAKASAGHLLACPRCGSASVYMVEFSYWSAMRQGWAKAKAMPDGWFCASCEQSFTDDPREVPLDEIEAQAVGMYRCEDGSLTADDTAGPFESIDVALRWPDEATGEVLTLYEAEGLDHEGMHRAITDLIGRIPNLDFEFVNVPPEGAMVGASGTEDA